LQSGKSYSNAQPHRRLRCTIDVKNQEQGPAILGGLMALALEKRLGIGILYTAPGREDAVIKVIVTRYLWVGRIQMVWLGRWVIESLMNITGSIAVENTS
jgi:hypothetical protein